MCSTEHKPLPHLWQLERSLLEANGVSQSVEWTRPGNHLYNPPKAWLPADCMKRGHGKFYCNLFNLLLYIHKLLPGHLSVVQYHV